MLFEGVASILAVLVLSSMIYWMAIRGKRLRGEVERRVESILTRREIFALTSFAFIIVFREGMETVLFLTPFLVLDPSATVMGLMLDLLASFLLSLSISLVGMRIDIGRFFYFTSLLLTILAGGLRATVSMRLWSSLGMVCGACWGIMLMTWGSPPVAPYIIRVLWAPYYP